MCKYIEMAKGDAIVLFFAFFFSRGRVVHVKRCSFFETHDSIMLVAIDLNVICVLSSAPQTSDPCTEEGSFSSNKASKKHVQH